MTTRSTRALVFRAPGELALEERALAPLRDGDALLRVEWCGICGSDLHVFSSGWRVAPGQVLGHEFSATVLEAPGVDGVAAGDRVVVNPLLGCADSSCRACLVGLQHLCQRRRGVLGLTVPGAFADLVVVPGARLGVELHRLPDTVPGDVGALHEPLTVARHAFEVSDVTPEDHVVVYGAGAIGLGLVRWLVRAGCATVLVVDPLPVRREAALRQGADAALAPEEPLGPLLGGAWTPGKADLVVDCAGVAAVIEDGLKIVRPGGRLTLAAVTLGPDAVSSTRVLDKEITVRGAQGFTVAEHTRAVAELPSWDAAPSVISHRFPLDGWADAFAAQLDRGASVKVLIGG
ncbi:alcohol dehydrogenase catalytic domain-containing protein [Conexibacter sp. W3-3-2]|uniref:zinc-dependent alcohol dehydrogenase n=1 Tax=Conexibacter sp. W3-3-2 TaxID=2675227 RepID=UPI0012B8CA8B|nr:alcohol dehydrogenase catalytic domain-containing protein [Conexibacter sp. W3-3-2]MTD46391.1 alcohol dehydrogenase catalytic domain-containing protein [Conexibacter sp. W3-3-2]